MILRCPRAAMLAMPTMKTTYPILFLFVVPLPAVERTGGLEIRSEA